MAVVGVSPFFLSHTVYIVYIYTQLIENSISSLLARRMVCQGNSHPLPNPLADAADPGKRETLTFDEGCSKPFLDMIHSGKLR